MREKEREMVGISMVKQKIRTHRRKEKQKALGKNIDEEEEVKLS